MKVLLISPPTIKASQLISHGARTCYEAEIPDLNAAPIDIKNRLWIVGHHTTSQHGTYTFAIEGIAVGDITLGLHLANVFYNSGQRSGRFCSGMFANPNFEEILKYIFRYYNISGHVSEVHEYLHFGYEVYGENIGQATEIAKQLIREERPLASENYAEQNGAKFAQEQLRIFIPIIFPTALDFSVDISALAALYQNAWSPALEDVTGQMAQLVLESDSKLASYGIFERSKDGFSNLPIRRSIPREVSFLHKPQTIVTSFGDARRFVVPSVADMFPVDSLPFNPRFMDNNVEELKTVIEISLATMGQDQRHRTVRRGNPAFTGYFYIPPIVAVLDLEEKAKILMEKWKNLFLNEEIPLPLACSLAPYGVMVTYTKSASYNALAHEMLKRLCWCAQEEIYHLSTSVALQVKNQLGSDCPLLQVMRSPCAMSGVCGEGKRCCGRDIKKSSSLGISRKV